MARLSAAAGSEQRQRNLLRTFEWIYHTIALVLGVILFIAAPVVASHWVHVQQLPLSQVTTSIRLMAIICALQFPFALYQSGLLGLQRHVLLNVIVMIGATLRTGGAVVVLLLVSRSIVGFFVWQAIVMFVQTVALSAVIWRIIGGMARARFDSRIVRGEWTFAASISANSLVGALITQSDKIILSAMAPLKDLGYYTISGTIAAALWFVILPVNTAIFPRFAQLWAERDESNLAQVFHKACQTIALLVLPPGVTLALFARPVVEVWTGSHLTADNAAMIVPLLVAGTTLYGLSSVPAYLQFAVGWPQLTLYTNIASVLVLIPMTIYTVSIFGPAGAALMWLSVNAAYFVPAVIMFHRILPKERRRWYVRDLGQPFAAAIVVGVVARLFAPTHTDRLFMIVYLVLSAFAIFISVFIASADVRAAVTKQLRDFILSHPMKAAGINAR